MVARTRASFYDSDQRRRPLIDELHNAWTYRGLLGLVVIRDLTVRYKRSTLGVWWTLLNPLLTSAVFWLVFSQLFRRAAGDDVPYVVYLLSGILLAQFFAQGVIAAGSAMLDSRQVLSKMYVPAEVLSLAAAAAAAANFLISLVPLLVIQIVTGVGIPWTVLLIPIPTLAMLALITGLGLLVASAAVHFYDVIDLTRVLAQLMTFLIPTFYPLEIVPERFLPFVKLNPLFSYLSVFRNFVFAGTFPPWESLVMMGLSSLGALVLGVWVFSRSWKSMVLAL